MKQRRRPSRLVDWKVPDSRRREWPVAAWVAILAIAATDVSAAVPPSGCTPIDSIPPVYSGIQFGAAIEGMFIDFNGQGNGCADCHTSAMHTQIPAGNLDLDPSESPSPYVNLINVVSAEDPSLIYVVPNRPDLSLLFQKVNCNTPGVGARMPYQGYPDGMTTLTPYQQAIIYDWIAEGAPAGTTNGIFRGAFDPRGFVVDSIFGGDFEQ